MGRPASRWRWCAVPCCGLAEVFTFCPWRAISGRLSHLLEKDIWVVWPLRYLFDGPHPGHLVFKGGTSMSKAYGVIRRFSEDVDLTYDNRAVGSDQNKVR
jgi:predicted nucleotidyltransferase component of viral defense system